MPSREFHDDSCLPLKLFAWQIPLLIISIILQFSPVIWVYNMRQASSNQKADPENAKSWPRFVLRVDRYMFNYLTSGKRTKLAVLSSSLKVWILLKVRVSSFSIDKKMFLSLKVFKYFLVNGSEPAADGQRSVPLSFLRLY